MSSTRKGITEGYGTIPFDNKILQDLKTRGYKYAQIKGLTADKHYDYIVSHFVALVPVNELSLHPDKKDIYEPVGVVI
jgi:hypothetical protein